MKKTEELKRMMTRLKGTSHRIPLKKMYDHDDRMVMEWFEKYHFTIEKEKRYLDSALCEIVFSETVISYAIGFCNAEDHAENLANQPPWGYDDLEKAYDDESYAENILSMIGYLGL